MTHDSWTRGNTITLLENGEAFFPAVFADIGSARQEVILETFIWLDDDIGRRLRSALLEAAANGASVDVTVDGHGSATLDRDFIEPLTNAGVRVHVFGPMAPKLGVQPNLIHRLHRKLVAIDHRIAYVGGINFSDAHMRYYGAESKQDYAVRAEGPVVASIRDFCFAAIGAIKREMNNRKWTWFAIGYQCGFAYVIALMINQFGGLFTGSANILGVIVAAALLAGMIYMLVRPYKEATKLSVK